MDVSFASVFVCRIGPHIHTFSFVTFMSNIRLDCCNTAFNIFTVDPSNHILEEGILCIFQGQNDLL